MNTLNSVSKNSGAKHFLFCFNVSSFAASGTATFLGTDTTTLGNWMGTYGSVGYYIPSGPSSTPSDGSTFSPGAPSLWTWGTNVTSTSPLKTSGGNIASCWYNNLGTTFPSLTLDVIIPAGKSQTVALYLLDYSQQGRSESVSVTDASNDSPPLTGPFAVSGANFVNGEYLIWQITGEVHINITLVNGPNAVASGIFFGGNSSMPPPVSGGAYITESAINPVFPGGDADIAKLTLPAGTYLLSASIIAQLFTPTSQGLEYKCYLTHTFSSGPNIITSFNQGAIVAGQPNTGTQNLSTTLQSSYTTEGTDAIFVNCANLSSAGILVDAVLTALTVPSVTRQFLPMQ